MTAVLDGRQAGQKLPCEPLVQISRYRPFARDMTSCELRAADRRSTICPKVSLPSPTRGRRRVTASTSSCRHFPRRSNEAPPGTDKPSDRNLPPDLNYPLSWQRADSCRCRRTQCPAPPEPQAWTEKSHRLSCQPMSRRTLFVMPDWVWPLATLEGGIRVMWKAAHRCDEIRVLWASIP